MSSATLLNSKDRLTRFTIKTVEKLEREKQGNRERKRSRRDTKTPMMIPSVSLKRY